jgi:hypothetical protein
MEAYCVVVRKLDAKFNGLELRHIPQRANEEADNVATIGLTLDMPQGGVFLDEFSKPLTRWDSNLNSPPSQAYLPSSRSQALTQTRWENLSTTCGTTSFPLTRMSLIECVGKLNLMS